MSATDISNLDLSGQPWSVWEEVIKKLDKNGTHEFRPPSRAVESDAMLLPRDDYWLFGSCPERDGLNLVVCNICGFAVKHLALAHHLETRHKAGGWKSTGIAIDSVQKEETKALPAKAGNIHSKSKPKPTINLLPKSSIPSVNVSLPLQPALASFAHPEKVKEKVRETLSLPPPTGIPTLKISTASKPQSHSKGESHSKSSTHSKSNSHSKSTSHSKTSSSSKSSQSSSSSSKSSSVPVASKDAVPHSSSKTVLPSKSSSTSKSSSSSASKTSPSSKSSPSNKSPSQSKSSSSNKSSSSSKSPSPGKSLLPVKSTSGKSSSSTKTTPSKPSSSSSSSKNQISTSSKSTLANKSTSSSSKSPSGSKSVLISKGAAALPTKSSVPTKSSSTSKEQVSLLASPGTPLVNTEHRTDVAVSAKIHSITLPQTNTTLGGKKKPRSDRKMLPIKDREYDADTHCGVKGADDTKPCTRSLTCKSHTLSLRRAVQGRSKNFDTLLSDHRAVKEAASKASKAASMPSNNHTIPANSATIAFQAAPLQSIPATTVSTPVLEAFIAQTTPKVVNTITQSGGSFIAVTMPSQSMLVPTSPHNSVLIPRTNSTKHVGSGSVRSVVHIASRPSSNTSPSAGISRPQQSFSVNQGKFTKTAPKQTSLLNRPVNSGTIAAPTSGQTSTVVSKSSAISINLQSVSPIGSRSPTYHKIILPNVRLVEEQVRTPTHHAQPIKSESECEPLDLSEDLLITIRSDSDQEDLDEYERNLSPPVLDLMEEADAPMFLSQSNGLLKAQASPPTSPRDTASVLAPNRKVPLSRQDTTEYTSVSPTKSPTPLKSTEGLLISNHATSAIETVITNMSRQTREVGEKFPAPSVTSPESVAKVAKVTFSNNWKPVPPQEVASPITLCNLSSVLSIPTTRPTSAQVHSVVARQQAQPIKILPIPSVSQKTLVKDTNPKIVKRLNDGLKTGGKKAKRKKLPDVNPAAIISTLLAKKQRRGGQIPSFKWTSPEPKSHQTDYRTLETMMALELQKERLPGHNFTQLAASGAGVGAGAGGLGSASGAPGNSPGGSARAVTNGPTCTATSDVRTDPTSPQEAAFSVATYQEVLHSLQDTSEYRAVSLINSTLPVKSFGLTCIQSMSAVDTEIANISQQVLQRKLHFGLKAGKTTLVKGTKQKIAKRLNHGLKTQTKKAKRKKKTDANRLTKQKIVKQLMNGLKTVGKKAKQSKKADDGSEIASHMATKQQLPLLIQDTTEVNAPLQFESFAWFLTSDQSMSTIESVITSMSRKVCQVPQNVWEVPEEVWELSEVICDPFVTSDETVAETGQESLSNSQKPVQPQEVLPPIKLCNQNVLSIPITSPPPVHVHPDDSQQQAQMVKILPIFPVRQNTLVKKRKSKKARHQSNRFQIRGKKVDMLLDVNPAMTTSETLTEKQQLSLSHQDMTENMSASPADAPSSLKSTEGLLVSNHEASVKMPMVENDMLQKDKGDKDKENKLPNVNSAMIINVPLTTEQRLDLFNQDTTQNVSISPTKSLLPPEYHCTNQNTILTLLNQTTIVGTNQKIVEQFNDELKPGEKQDKENKNLDVNPLMIISAQFTEKEQLSLSEYKSVSLTKSPPPLTSTEGSLNSNYGTSAMGSGIINMSQQVLEVGEKFSATSTTSPDDVAEINQNTLGNNQKPLSELAVPLPTMVLNQSSMLSIPTMNLFDQDLQIPSVSQSTLGKDTNLKIVEQRNDGLKTGEKIGKENDLPAYVSPVMIISAHLAKKLQLSLAQYTSEYSAASQQQAQPRKILSIPSISPYSVVNDTNPKIVEQLNSGLKSGGDSAVIISEELAEKLQQSLSQYVSEPPATSPSLLKSTDELLISNHATSAMTAVITSMSQQITFAESLAKMDREMSSSCLVEAGILRQEMLPLEASPITLTNKSGVLSTNTLLQVPEKGDAPSISSEMDKKAKSQGYKAGKIKLADASGAVFNRNPSTKMQQHGEQVSDPSKGTSPTGSNFTATNSPGAVAVTGAGCPDVNSALIINALLDKKQKLVELRKGKSGVKKGKKKEVPEANAAVIISAPLATTQQHGSEAPDPSKETSASGDNVTQLAAGGDSGADARGPGCPDVDSVLIISTVLDKKQKLLELRKGKSATKQEKNKVSEANAAVIISAPLAPTLHHGFQSADPSKGLSAAGDVTQLAADGPGSGDPGSPNLNPVLNVNSLSTKKLKLKKLRKEDGKLKEKSKSQGEKVKKKKAPEANAAVIVSTSLAKTQQNGGQGADPSKEISTSSHNVTQLAADGPGSGDPGCPNLNPVLNVNSLSTKKLKLKKLRKEDGKLKEKSKSQGEKGKKKKAPEANAAVVVSTSLAKTQQNGGQGADPSKEISTSGDNVTQLAADGPGSGDPGCPNLNPVLNVNSLSTKKQKLKKLRKEDGKLKEKSKSQGEKVKKKKAPEANAAVIVSTSLAKTQQNGGQGADPSKEISTSGDNVTQLAADGPGSGDPGSPNLNPVLNVNSLSTKKQKLKKLRKEDGKLKEKSKSQGKKAKKKKAPEANAAVIVSTSLAKTQQNGGQAADPSKEISPSGDNVTQLAVVGRGAVPGHGAVHGPGYWYHFGAGPCTSHSAYPWPVVGLGQGPGPWPGAHPWPSDGAGLDSGAGQSTDPWSCGDTGPAQGSGHDPGQWPYTGAHMWSGAAPSPWSSAGAGPWMGAPVGVPPWSGVATRPWPNAPGGPLPWTGAGRGSWPGDGQGAGSVVWPGACSGPLPCAGVGRGHWPSAGVLVVPGPWTHGPIAAPIGAPWTGRPWPQAPSGATANYGFGGSGNLQ